MLMCCKRLSDPQKHRFRMAWLRTRRSPPSECTSRPTGMPLGTAVPDQPCLEAPGALSFHPVTVKALKMASLGFSLSTVKRPRTMPNLPPPACNSLLPTFFFSLGVMGWNKDVQKVWRRGMAILYERPLIIHSCNK